MDEQPLRRVIRRVPLSQVTPSGAQPRRVFRDESIDALAASIERDGLLSPPMVRPCPGGYELIAGERRLRALRRLGAVAVDALVVDATDGEAAVLALVENLQRASLSPIDEAEGYERLVREFRLSHAEIAHAVGRERSTVANAIRLLQLPKSVQQLLDSGALSAGHARALLSLEDDIRLDKTGKIAEYLDEVVTGFRYRP